MQKRDFGQNKSCGPGGCIPYIKGIKKPNLTRISSFSEDENPDFCVKLLHLQMLATN